MERRRQARTPVNINALLVGKKTVPKGCRVMNVSQNGMLLQCDADGRLLTFSDGDDVDVHLVVQHEGEQKKLTIPCCVRHVAANSIDVEFLHPDPALLNLIESYRISENHKLEASLNRMDRRTGNARVASISGSATGPEKPSGQPEESAQRQNNRPFYAAILAIVFAICIITGGYVYTASIDSRISTLETISERQSTELSEMQSRVFSASLQEGRYASLNARIAALSEAFVSLENSLGQTIPPSASASLHERQPADAPAGEQENSSTSRASENMPAAGPGPEPAKQVSARQPATPTAGPGTTLSTPATAGANRPAISRKKLPDPVAAATGTVTDILQQNEQQGAKPQAGDGPWVINLLSSRDKAYVERFSKRSGAAEHNAELNSAMVKGKQYWRLQISGFESAAEARNQAKTVKQKLGIKEVWIFKRN